MKKCQRCGTDYPDRDRFCMECGSSLEAGPKPEKPRKAKPRRITEPAVSAGVPEMDSRIRELSRRVGGMDSRFAGRQEIEDLKESIVARLASGVLEDNERFEALEKEMRQELDRMGRGFMKGLKAQLDSATRRVSGLEANLSRLMEGFDRLSESRMERFRAGLNENMRNKILQLRGEVSEKTGIINRLSDNLTKQISLNERRYAELEARLKKELGDIENFKTGLAVQQDEFMKQLKTEFLERVGEIKKLGEDLILQQQKKMLVMEEKLNEVLGELEVGGLKDSGISAAERRIEKGMRKMEGLREEVEGALSDIKRLEEDLVLHQHHRLSNLEARMGLERGLEAGEGTNIKTKKKKYNRLLKKGGERPWRVPGES